MLIDCPSDTDFFFDKVQPGTTKNIKCKHCDENHSLTGPSWVDHDHTGIDIYLGWYYHGLMHCATGPARIRRRVHKVDLKDYWLFGIKLPDVTVWEKCVPFIPTDKADMPNFLAWLKIMAYKEEV